MINVLLVEDDEGDAFMAREALESAEFSNNLHIVHDGLQALDFFRKEKEFSGAPTPDLVLLDINMPRMNGHEVLSWMRGDEGYTLTPVIIFTTSSSQEDIVLRYKNHGNCFVTKPVEQEQFDKVVKMINEFWAGVVQLPP